MNLLSVNKHRLLKRLVPQSCLRQSKSCMYFYNLVFQPITSFTFWGNTLSSDIYYDVK